MFLFMEKKNGNGATNEGACCDGGLWGHHHWGHMLVKVIIILFVFWAGAEFGELKAELRAYHSGGYGAQMMGGWGEHNVMFTTDMPAPGGASWGTTDSGGVKIQMISTSSRPY